jgi:hypothetical protein
MKLFIYFLFVTIALTEGIKFKYCNTTETLFEVKSIEIEPKNIHIMEAFVLKVKYEIHQEFDNISHFNRITMRNLVGNFKQGWSERVCKAHGGCPIKLGESKTETNMTMIWMHSEGRFEVMVSNGFLGCVSFFYDVLGPKKVLSK